MFPAIGLAVIVVLAVAVYISYNANSGLPWESTYELTADVPNADRLSPDDSVRVAGVRVGRVRSVTAMRPRGGDRPFARVRMALETSAGPLPVDSGVSIRSASVLGATYVDLRPGDSKRTMPSGGRLRPAKSSDTVQITDLLGMFDRATGRSIRRTFGELGAGFAGRGTALNATLRSTGHLLAPLSRVNRTLADPSTRLPGFVRGYQSFVAALEPVRGELGGLVAGSGTTFDAMVRPRGALGATLEAAPPAERAATDALDRIRPSLHELAALAPDLRVAAKLLPGALAQANRALTAGVPPLKQTPPVAARLGSTFAAFDALSREPSTDGTLRKSTDMVTAVGSLLDLLTPAQLQCNVIGVYGDTLPTVFGALGTGEGPSVTNVVVASGGAKGESFQNAAPSENVGINSLPNETADECEAGNEIYDGKQHLNNPPGNQRNRTRDTSAPPAALARARQAGLLDKPSGWTP
jgi:virulence factor Mce-like protein